jgi:uncharacterized membrane protein YjjP (DUF1212 family)
VYVRQAVKVTATSDEVEKLIAALGQAQLAAGYPVNEVDETLRNVARSYGRSDLQIYVLPNAVFVDDEQTGRSRIVASDMGTMRLDQASAVHRIARRAEVNAVSPAQAILELGRINSMVARFPAWLVILANGLSAAGFALLFRVSLWGVLIAGILGVLLAIVLRLTAKHPSVAAIVPFASATVAAFIVFTLAANFGEAVQPIRVVAAPLITLIPGIAITRGTQELANGQVVSGSSRLVSGLVQILVLAFGVLFGARLAPIDSYDFGDVTDVLLPWWAAWIGVIVFAIGQSIVSNEARGGIRFVVALLVISYGVQTLVSLAGDAVIATGAAAAVALFLAIVMQRRSRQGMPAFAVFEPVFWLLVPGSLGLVALTQALAEGDPAFGPSTQITGSTSVLFVAAASLLAMTIGMIIGSAVGRLVPSRPITDKDED